MGVCIQEATLLFIFAVSRSFQTSHTTREALLVHIYNTILGIGAAARMTVGIKHYFDLKMRESLPLEYEHYWKNKDIAESHVESRSGALVGPVLTQKS